MNNMFGMFIHWGIYAIGGRHEQEIARYDISHEEYDKYVSIFNPVKFDAEQIVLLAKNAGMKYICVTAKHHDGFCMWDTKYTDYCVMNTPYGKDIIAMFAEACKKHDIKLSLYYSCPDWHHPWGYNYKSTHQWKSVQTKKSDFSKYKEYVLNQITELLTNYGKIYTLFWDIPPKFEDRSINDYVRKLQPEILINNRGWDEGDFSTPEREYGDSGSGARKMVEACNSVGEQSWAYRSDEDYHSVRYLTHSIDEIMAKGGNYLLNIGPKGDGSIDDIHIALIERIGDWYNRMCGSLESAELDNFDYGVKKYKCIVTRKNGKSYFNFCSGITSSAVSMKNYPSLPKYVKLLNTGELLPFRVMLLPEYFEGSTGKATEHLHIQKINIDSLENEPIVLEIEWE